MTFDRATIAAYVDGELDLLTAKRIEVAMAEDEGLADAVARERALRAKLSAHFDAVLDEPVPDSLAALLQPAANVDTSFADRLQAKETARKQPIWVQWGSMAAALALGLVVGGFALGGGRDGIAGGGDMVASGALASALDSQLASTQGTDAKIRIGTSFAAKDGSYCRTFESASLDGIACKGGGAWQLRQTIGGQSGSEYRQASSGALAEAAAAMMAGDPFDATQEKAARDKGWAK